MFSYEFNGISKNTFFTEHLRATTASFSLHYDRVFDKIYYRVLIKACNLWFEHNIHKTEKKTILSYQHLILPIPLSTQCQILMQAP